MEKNSPRLAKQTNSNWRSPRSVFSTCRPILTISLLSPSITFSVQAFTSPAIIFFTSSPCHFSSTFFATALST